MKQITAILNKLLAIAQNGKVWLRVLVFVVVATGCVVVGAVYYSKTKTKVDQSCEQERARLINFITEMNKDLAYVPTSFITFASYQQDTIPKVTKWRMKMDSLLLKHKQDSINKLKSKL